MTKWQLLSRWLGVALLFAVLAAGVPAGAGILKAQAGGGTISVTPATQTLVLGESTTVEITIAAEEMFGFQFIVAYDTARLTATSAALDDGWFDGSFSPWNGTIDDAAGTVKFASSLERGQTPPTGQGVVARITFRGDAHGVADLAFSNVKLVRFVGGEQGTEIITPVTETPGTIVVQGLGDVTGTVRLQGRSDHAGATVGLDGLSVTTGADGSYSLTDIAQGTYTVTVEMPRYLDASRSGVTVTAGMTTTLPQVLLLGGDADDNDVIDILDATIIGNNFGRTEGLDVRADINNDGEVDVIDLVLMGGNYGETSPVSW